MKYLLALALSLSASSLLAQIHKKTTVVSQPQIPVEYALVRGHITNNTAELFDYGTDDFLAYNVASLPVDKDGNFSRKIRIEKSTREIMLRVGDGIPLKLMPNDTVDLAWDNNNINGTLTIKANKEIRTAEFQKAFKLRLLSNENQWALHDLHASKDPDSVKFRQVNDRFNKEIESLLVNDTYHLASKMAVDVYFEYARLLLLRNMFPHFELYLKTDEAKKTITWMNSTSYWDKPYKGESEDNFLNSAAYRNFIFDYPRTMLFSYRSAVNGTQSKFVGLTPSFSDYYRGLSAFDLIEIRDWFITKSIFTDFGFYDFDDASKVYKDFLTKVKTPYYADTLKAFYTNIQHLRPNSPAPIFKLKNEEGKLVSLNDFKGKVVYIDFWGVGCGPCVAAIKSDVPALHESYKDKNVVFINICVDSDEKTWKENLKKLNLHGVNLIAQGWTRNPVCNTYNVTAIPHYYLIDKAGQIANNNSKGPGYGINADIDKLLK